MFMKRTDIFYLLFIFFAGLSIVSAQEIPTINTAKNNYTLQDIFYLDGAAKPNVTVELNFTKSGEKPLVHKIKSDDKGKWAFAQKLNLADGEWEVRIRIISSDNSVSEWSDPLFFSSATTARQGNNLFWVFVFILLFTVAAILARIFFLRKNRIKKDNIIKDIRKAELKTKENFSALEHDATVAFDAMGAFSLAENETAAEKEKIKNKISALEAETEKEMRDIEKII